MKKYAARINNRFNCDAKISEVEIDKETDTSVWINGKRRAKRSLWMNYYDTWEEARDGLLLIQQWRVEMLRSQLKRANSALENIEGMRR